MDPNVPTGAAMLLDLIGHAETARDAPEAYGVIIGHRQNKLGKPLTDFTLDELLAAQKLWVKNWNGSAAGRYQIIRKTLLGLVAELELPGSVRFTPDVQDRMGYALLKRRGYADFVAGKTTGVEFGRSLAQEWASFPVLAPTQGATRKLTRGQSYYSGDGVNKALITPEQVENALLVVKIAAGKPAAGQEPRPKPPVPADRPKAASAPSAGLGGIIAAIIKAIAAFFGRNRT